MGKIEEILHSNLKPKEKQTKLVEAVCQGKIKDKEFFDFFKSASDVDKGTCADVMKHVSAQKPEFFLPYVDILVDYVNYKAPRVKWGVPESIGNIAKKYPQKVEKAIPYLLKNAVENKENTTVIRWCAAYALSEITKASKNKELIKKIEGLSKKEKNNGIKNVYLKALKEIEKNKK
ncbi:hypothetical protein HYW21_06605 [Candidatus Woesearchaeota archaeon]|nr:hypothetical protein [Candidatus Woesearchaeota archaeon]